VMERVGRVMEKAGCGSQLPFCQWLNMLYVDKQYQRHCSIWLEK